MERVDVVKFFIKKAVKEEVIDKDIAEEYFDMKYEELNKYK